MKLDADVVYAILAAIVAISLIVHTTRIVKLRTLRRREPVVLEPTPAETAPWPAVSPER